jgi:SAM-dependent methyltransferase
MPTRDWSQVQELTEKGDRRAYYDFVAGTRADWLSRNRFYHEELASFCRQVVPPGRSVLQIGCGTGHLLQALQPARGVGVDFSLEMVRQARSLHPGYDFFVGDAEALPLRGTFDYVVLSNVLGDLSDVWQAFRELRRVCRPDTRVVLTHYNFLWEPLVKAAESAGLKVPQFYQNWLSLDDVNNLLELNGFETIRMGYRCLLPFSIPLLSSLCNRLLVKLPLLRSLGLVSFATARLAAPVPAPGTGLSCTVVIPTRNEAGNIAAAVEQVPEMGSHTELLFVDGDSTDGTVEKIEELIERYRGVRDIKLIHQVPRGGPEANTGKMLSLGKGDAVRKGFEAASGEVLIILDSDLTVPPQELPKFLTALAENRGELVNGTRLVYQMEHGSMRFLNMLANHAFSLLFTWLLEQPIRDTLCGTKALLKRDYRYIVANRSHFGDFDPFGDFDLLFGAARLNLKIVDIPIHYRARTYGDIKIERWKHGVLLLRMCLLAFRKLKLS